MKHALVDKVKNMKKKVELLEAQKEQLEIELKAGRCVCVFIFTVYFNCARVLAVNFFCCVFFCVYPMCTFFYPWDETDSRLAVKISIKAKGKRHSISN